ncbi:NUDIX domain-containing protein [Stappia stellulata]|uniref:NUDIX domain-containing protein n=1 Tax=Stappia stellulata TaxID=71235 RepID=UPI000414FAA8|nr:NUDIX domain-containing protein [Stappia stellulata]
MPSPTSLPMRLMRRITLTANRLRRSMTLGVRVAAYSDDGRILLVRHGYMPGWYLPGGAVDAGETLAEAAERELLEETGVRARARLRLFSMYLNARMSPRDHVALFCLDKVLMADPPPRPGLEIRESGFFALADLPDDTTPATRRRIAEIAGAAPVNARW